APRGGGAARAGGRPPLPAATRRLPVEPERLDELPARLGARAAVGTRIAPVLDAAVVRDGKRVDAAATLDEALRDARAFGRAEDALFAHGADGRLRDLHLGPPHALLGTQAERDLLLQRHLDGVPFHRRRELAARGRDRRQVHARARAGSARARESDGAECRVARPLL